MGCWLPGWSRLIISNALRWEPASDRTTCLLAFCRVYWEPASSDVFTVVAMKQLPSPKQPSGRCQRDWYPYYAGYTESFVEEVASALFADHARVLDPWNGSGTTSAVCSRLGLEVVGLDINPALTVIAKARETPRSTRASLSPLGFRLLALAKETAPLVEDGDPLLAWMRRPAVARLRALQRSIDASLVSEPLGEETLLASPEALPVLACFFYTALFSTVRETLSAFRTTNPTWIVSPPSSKHRLAPSWSQIEAQFVESIIYFTKRLRMPDHASPSQLLTGSARSLPFRDGEFDGVVTSPPYATRIDYIRSSLPELMVLRAGQQTILALRRESTGSPVVGGVTEIDVSGIESEVGRSILALVGEHPSKGSRAYYQPWLSQYLWALQQGLHGLARVVKPAHPIVVVVQDSHYKEVRLDLQSIVREVFAAVGRKLVGQQDFAVRTLRSRMNPHARRHLPERINHESVLVFA